jgi:hypothetical protein
MVGSGNKLARDISKGFFIVLPLFICNALTLCRTKLSLLFARGPLTDDVRSSLVGSGADGGEAIETDLVNDAAFGARSTTLGLVVAVEIARLGALVGGAGIGILGGPCTVGERPPTGRGEAGKLIRNTDPDLIRVDNRSAGETSETVDPSFNPVPLGVETSTPLGNTLR